MVVAAEFLEYSRSKLLLIQRGRQQEGCRADCNDRRRPRALLWNFEPFLTAAARPHTIDSLMPGHVELDRGV